MKKLYGFLISAAAVLTGLLLYVSGSSPVLSAAILFVGVGINLYYERQVITGASTQAEKTVCMILPPISEVAILLGIIYVTGFETLGLIYLSVVLILSEILGKSDKLGTINQSKLLGRISRVLVLIAGLALSQFNTYLAFYAVVFTLITVLYDLAILFSDAFTSSSI